MPGEALDGWRSRWGDGYSQKKRGGGGPWGTKKDPEGIKHEASQGEVEMAMKDAARNKAEKQLKWDCDADAKCEQGSGGKCIWVFPKGSITCKEQRSKKAHTGDRHYGLDGPRTREHQTKEKDKSGKPKTRTEHIVKLQDVDDTLTPAEGSAVQMLVLTFDCTLNKTPTCTPKEKK